MHICKRVFRCTLALLPRSIEKIPRKVLSSTNDLFARRTMTQNTQGAHTYIQVSKYICLYAPIFTELSVTLIKVLLRYALFLCRHMYVCVCVMYLGVNQKHSVAYEVQ